MGWDLPGAVLTLTPFQSRYGSNLSVHLGGAVAQPYGKGYGHLPCEVRVASSAVVSVNGDVWELEAPCRVSSRPKHYLAPHVREAGS